MEVALVFSYKSFISIDSKQPTLLSLSAAWTWWQGKGEASLYLRVYRQECHLFKYQLFTTSLYFAGLWCWLWGQNLSCQWKEQPRWKDWKEVSLLPLVSLPCYLASLCSISFFLTSSLLPSLSFALTGTPPVSSFAKSSTLRLRWAPGPRLKSAKALLCLTSPFI